MLNAFVPWLAAIIPPSLSLVSLWGRFKLSENWNRWYSRTEPCILESMRVSKSWWEKETNWCFRNVFTGRCCGAPTAVQLLNNVHIIIIMNSWMKPNAAFFPVFWCSSIPPLDICSVITATAVLIMQWLQEACGSRFESYFHVAAHFPICSFLQHKHRPHSCLPTAASLTGTHRNDDCVSQFV